jgi:hypothetical protein
LPSPDDASIIEGILSTITRFIGKLCICVV